MADASENESKPFDKFELATAVLLGLAAIGAALANQQAGQWGGKQLDAFSSSNALTTKAAKQYNEDTVLVNADYAAVAAAKEHIMEARDARDPQARERHLDMASYQYTSQMTGIGYKAMALPTGYFVEDEDEAEATPAAAEPEAATEESTEEPADAETEAHTALVRDIPDEALFGSLHQELDEKYIEEMTTDGNKMFAEADAKFEQGRVANGNGDRFDLVGVFYTVGLFFAGLGLVFKTNIRWSFCGLGALVVLGATLYMFTLPWTS